MQNRILHSRLAQRAAVALGAAALPALSFAQGLPQLENPTRGTGNGIMEGDCGRRFDRDGFCILPDARQSPIPTIASMSSMTSGTARAADG